MAKGKKSKKKNLKLRRQLRKTLGCLFMISALIVSAIPVSPTEAAAGTGWVSGTGAGQDGFFVHSDGQAIPTIQTSSTYTPPVYRDESGNFFFVFVDDQGNGNPANSKPDKFAMIVDFQQNQTLPNGRLTIPATMDAYIRITDSGGIGTYAAANKMGYPLYFKSYETTASQRSAGGEWQMDADGNMEYVEAYVATPRAQTFLEYLPCLETQKDNWCPDGMTDVQLYYYDDSTKNGIPPSTATKVENDPNWKPVLDNTNNRIANATVQYIAKQYAVYNSNNSGYTFHNCDENKSIFGGTGEGVAASHIISLTFEQLRDSSGKEVGSPLTGIGAYAFYNCTNLESISLGNGLATLGDYSFSNCRNLKDVDLPYNARVERIGAYAFANCGKLQRFPVPTTVKGIGDYCFSNCLELETVDLSGALFDQPEGSTGLASSLEQIGYYAFNNCQALKYLDLPRSYNGAERGSAENTSEPNAPVFHLSTVKGCTSLEHIKTYSPTLRFVTDAEAPNDKQLTVTDSSGTGQQYTRTFYTGGYAGKGKVDGTYTFANFKADVGDDFYFEAPAYETGTNNTVKTPTHNIANVRHICFKYDGQDKYEIVEPTLGIDAGGSVIDIGLVFAVDTPGNLVDYHAEDPESGEVLGVQVPEVTMPAKVGPHEIRSLIEGSFTDDCWIEKVTIPASVTNIGANTFKGSHNLRHIIFDAAENIETMGADAFATQVVRELHDDKSAYPHNCDTPKADFLNTTVTPFMSFTGSVTDSEMKRTVPFDYAMKASSKINAGEQQPAYITYYSGMPTNLTIKYNPDTQLSELQYFPTKADVNAGFEIPTDASGNPEYVGAYQPFTKNGKSSTYYRFPYITDAVAAEIKGAFTNSAPSENQTNIKNGVENIVIPNGVNSVKKGLFSGLDENGGLIEEVTVTETDDQGNTVNTVYKVGEKPPKDWKYEDAQDIKSLTTQSISDIEPYTFAGMDGMESAYINGATTIGDYAFDDCDNLGMADIGSTTSTLGLRPFRGCDKLADVKFQTGSDGGSFFVCEDAVIYGTAEDGKTKEKIIECLEGRGTVVTNTSRGVGPDELEGIKSIAPEAFMDCDNVNIVDLSKSSITEVPDRTFAEMDKLFQVILPDMARIIRNKAFVNTPALGYVTVPPSVTNIAPDTFAYMDDIYDESEIPSKIGRASCRERVCGIV